LDDLAAAYPNTRTEEHSLSLIASYKLYRGGDPDLEAALQALEELREKYPQSKLDPKLDYEEAKIYEQQNSSGRLIAGPASGEVLALRARRKYEALRERYPGTLVAALAELELQKYRTPDPTAVLPAEYALHPAYPNPFNPKTTLRYDLPENSRVRLTIYDLMGREVVVLEQGFRPAGIYRVVWRGRDRSGRPVASGVYLYRFHAVAENGKRRFQRNGKVVLLK
jgi:hypothetical protein